ncbi:MAG: polyketide synthase dehydratase domain-containing protein, partial [Acidobacteriaceae bacterium]|nr:polyketide synthase dehydratase domain-containing protein [Acidobacteriaceae bacterium]
TLTALETQLRQTNAWLEQEKPNLANLSYTLIKGRSMFEERTAVMAASHQELASKINLCLSKQSAAALPADAQLWLKGDRTACVGRASELRRQGAAHIIAPLYPFEKQSFWPVDINSSIPDSNFRVDGRESFLTDHLIHGRPTVPGVVLLCLAYRSLPVGYQLRDFTWTRPLVWSGQAIDLAVRWRHVSQTYEFTIESKEGTHASGRASRQVTSNSSDRVDLETLKGRLNSPLMASDVYARFSKLGFNYGPALQGIAELRTGSTEAFALLRSPISDEKAPLQFPFSIGILDGAIQTLLGLQVSGVAWTPVPFSVREFFVHRAIGDQCYVWLRLTGQGTDWLRFDIDFLDQTGNVLAQLREFTVRPLAGQQVTFPAVSKNSVQTLLIRTLAREVGLEESQISVRESFSRYGIDSMMVLNMTRELESTFSELPKTLFFEFNSIAALADHLSAQFPNVVATAAEAPQSTPLPVKASSREETIAIVGISGRFPEAANLDEFWENLRAGRDCIREIPLSRWDHSRYFASDRGQVGKTCSRWGGFLNQVEYFDPLLFRISPREAEVMDPQERLFLEVVWEAIENAGYTPADFSNQTVGVYAGAMYTQYQLYGAEAGALGTPLALTSSQAAIANRVSYFFDFQGPSIGLDTMCSSSLTAIHLACDALRRGEIEAAIAGGVNLTLHPQKYLLLSQANVASSDGRCRSFGAGGDGYVPGEGVGAVLLKPLSRALADGDTVHGLIRGSAINHGGRTNGFTVPSVAAQAAVISRCLEQASVEPSRISYIEAHGTGTALGDPIELAALDRAFAKAENNRVQCAIGSVKSNIGHLESAAGMASLAKVLLQMRYRELVPSIHAATLNPNLAFERSHFTLQRTLTSWLSPQEETRLAGISSFGAGGANAHLIVEEFSANPLPEVMEAQVLPLSARTPELLHELCRRMAAFADRVATGNDPNRPRLADVAYTLQVGRTTNEYRMAIVASS